VPSITARLKRLKLLARSECSGCAIALVDHYYGASRVGHALLADRPEQHPDERPVAAAPNNQQVCAVGLPEKRAGSWPLDDRRNYLQTVRLAEDAMEGLAKSSLGVGRGVVAAR
jgi:hypothetical protein